MRVLYKPHQISDLVQEMKRMIFFFNILMKKHRRARGTGAYSRAYISEKKDCLGNGMNELVPETE